MTLQECYEKLGGNYQEVRGRLPSDRMIQKFVIKFLADGSYDLLHSAIEGHRDEEAFRAAHTLKGVCQNLSFDRLHTSSHNITEALRNGPTPEVPQLLAQVDEDYRVTVEAIREFEQSVT